MTELNRRTLITTAVAGAAGAGLVGAANAQDASPRRVRPLEGKVAFVTGGARGIGGGCALELARAGASVALYDIAEPNAFPAIPYPMASRSDLDEGVRMVEAEGVRALGLVGDVRDIALLRAAMEEAQSALGGLDIVVANAGINLAEDDVAVYDPDTFDTIMAVNAGGVAKTIKAASELLPQPGGRIIVITSQEGRSGSGSFSYGSSKWAASGLMKNAALNLGPSGITVNAVAPGSVETAMAYRDNGGDASPEARERGEAGGRESNVLPLGQLQPEDIGRAVVFLSGPAPDPISGVTVDVNAGRSGRFLG